MKNNLILLAFIVVIASLASAQPPPPPTPPAFGEGVSAPVITPVSEPSPDTVPDTIPSIQKSDLLENKVSLLQQELDKVKAKLDEIDSSQRVPPSISLPLVILVLLNAALVGLVIYLLVTQSKKRKQEDETSLKNYIGARLHSGANFTTIKQELVQRGWSEDKIDQAYQE